MIFGFIIGVCATLVVVVCITLRTATVEQRAEDAKNKERLDSIKRRIQYHIKAIQLIASGRGDEVPPLGTHEDERK